MSKSRIATLAACLALIAFGIAADTDRNMVITADNEIKRGVYSNLTLISHRKEEFVVDFLFVDPQRYGEEEKNQALLVSRVILSPGHMKRLYEAIGENLSRYEESFGWIPPSESSG
jgi:hypothetical protein